MNTRTVLLGVILCLGVQGLLRAANIDRATITEVVNSVSVIEPASKRTSAAKVQQLFTAPNVLRTGADSRAEMIAPDQTVTRVGQSTLFSFEPNSREINLQRGSILFQSPSGKGGGTIRTSAASAAVLGTTLVVVTTKNGGFKVLLLEGRGRVRSGATIRHLRGGQMVYALPGGALSGTFEFRLAQQVSAARLVNGFKRGLPSTAKIQQAISKQEKDIAQGKATDTGLLASGSPNFAFRIDVARETLVDEALGEEQTPEQIAASTDAIISTPDLEQARVFQGAGIVGDPVLIGASNEAQADVPIRASNPATFLANNITFDTPTVSLAPFASNDLLQFVAVNDINLAQSVDFGAGNLELALIAGRTITAAPDTVVTADVPAITLAALGSTLPTNGSGIDSIESFSTEVPFELTDFQMRNEGGTVLLVGGDVKLTRVQLLSDNLLGVRTAGNLTIDGAEGAVMVVNPEFTFVPDDAQPKFSVLAAREAIRVNADKDVSIQRTSMRAQSISVRSQTVLKLTTVQINDESVPAVASIGPTNTGGVRLFGKELADLRFVIFNSNDVMIQSNTIRLESVIFRDSSRVVLESQIGRLAANPNTGQPVQPGMVNFVRNVRYGNAPAEASVIQNGPAPTPSGNGIIIRPLSNN